MKSGQEIAKENVARLQAWLEARAGAVPYLSDGRVNRSRLAAEAGLDRQVFRNNPVCRAIVEELLRNLKSSYPLTDARSVSEGLL